MNMRQLPSEERPREKLLRAGKENLSTTEILAILLRSGTKDRSALELASDLITISPDGIGYLAECRPEELASIGGSGLQKPVRSWRQWNWENGSLPDLLQSVFASAAQRISRRFSWSGCDITKRNIS